MRVADLFSGAGGFHLALQRLGKIVIAVENNRQAQATYATNFPYTPLVGDIRGVESLPEHDLLCGGFPCQPFSVAAAERKAEGMEDPRSTLFLEIVRLLKQSRPKAFLLENVPGLIHHDKGRTLGLILRELEGAGYAVSQRVISAQAWVPQDRKRLYLMGVRTENAGDLDLVFRLNAVKVEIPPKPWPVLGSVLESGLGHHFDLTEAQIRSVRKAFKDTGRSPIISRDLNLAAPTLVARNPSRAGCNAILVKGEGGLRRITPREAARLMGFPDWFMLPASQAQAYQQLGNAVVPQVIQAIVQAMMPLINE